MIAKNKQFILFLYNHSLIRYIFVGGTTFVLDFLLLVGLHEGLKLNIVIATTVSYWTAIAYNFLLNRRWTFSNKDKENLHKHILLYGLLLCFNYIFTVVFVSVVSSVIYFAWAKIIAVLIQTTWTYYLYKNYVFKNSAQEE